jgi:hypothetical protein
MKNAFLLLTLLLPGSAFAQQWYNNVKATRDDPYSFNVTFNSAGQMFNVGLRLGGNIATGYYYAEMSQATLNSYWNAPTHTTILDEYLLTSASASTYKSFFRSKGEGVGIPVLASIAGLAGGQYQLIGLLEAGSTILDAVDEATEDHRASAIALAELMAGGGKFVRELVIEKDANNHYFANMFSAYLIKVGQEERRYVLSKSRMAIRVL